MAKSGELSGYISRNWVGLLYVLIAILGFIGGMLVGDYIPMKRDNEISMYAERFEWVGSNGTMECIFVSKGGVGAVYCPDMKMCVEGEVNDSSE